MPAVSKAGITELLNAWSNGDQSALNKLASLILPYLRRIAKHHLDRERPGHSLQTTALVNEAYLRLVGMRKVNWKVSVRAAASMYGGFPVLNWKGGQRGIGKTAWAAS